MDLKQRLALYDDKREGLGRGEQCVVLLLAVLIIISRRPYLVSNTQFYAEGGKWYAQAYNVGWIRALPLPVAGYFNIFPRLLVGFCLLVPLQFAPLLTNIFGIAVQVLPVLILLSARSAGWGRLPVRLFMAGVYLVLPNSSEVNVVLASVQSHLALIACLLAFTEPPAGRGRWKIFDFSVLVLSGLSGPFCIALLPVAVVFWWVRRTGWSRLVVGIMAVAFVMQSISLLSGGLQSRARVEGQALGATPLLFMKILTSNVFVGALAGSNRFGHHANLAVILTVFFLGSAVLGYCLLKGNLALRLFIMFSMCLFVASLKSPLITGSEPLWNLLVDTSGGRYWFFPTLVFVWSIIWCVMQPVPRPFKIFGVIALLILARGVVHDWKQGPLIDQHFSQYVREFDAAPSGTPVIIPICPEKWTITLIKGHDSRLPAGKQIGF